ncbi:Universal stress protein A-like protein [Glycine soja]
MASTSNDTGVEALQWLKATEPPSFLTSNPTLSKAAVVLGWLISGYLFSPDINAAIEKYSQEVADCVLEKTKKFCKNLQIVMVETRVESGDPRDVICDMSQKLGADLLIMGSHDYGVVKKAFLESVSNYCSQNVKCPVLIVKKPKPSAGAGK